MSEQDDYIQTKHDQYGVFTQILFWVSVIIFLTMAVLAVIFF